MLWTRKFRGPMADVESEAREALRTLERERYSGATLSHLQQLIDDTARVGRVTASWETPLPEPD